MSPRNQVSGSLTEAYTAEIRTATNVPCRGVFPRSAPPSGDLPAPRGHSPPCSRLLLGFCHQRWRSRGPADSRCRCSLCASDTKTRSRKSGCQAGVPTPGTRSELPTGPGAPLAAVRLSRARPPAAAASIINGGSGVQRLPPRETLPGRRGRLSPLPGSTGCVGCAAGFQLPRCRAAGREEPRRCRHCPCCNE